MKTFVIKFEINGAIVCGRAQGYTLKEAQENFLQKYTH